MKCKMRRNIIDDSVSGHGCCSSLTAADTTQPLKNNIGRTNLQSKAMCESCNMKSTEKFLAASSARHKNADGMTPAKIFFVVGWTGEFARPHAWFVAAYEDEQDANDHAAAAQASADRLFREHYMESALAVNKIGDMNVKDLGDSSCLKNAYDPYFSFDHRGVRYGVGRLTFFKASQGLQVVKRWAAGIKE